MAVICGSGNNAGDGYLLAALARQSGFDVRVAALSDPHRLRDDAARAFAQWRDQNLSLAADVQTCLQSADVIVDALLGTGTSRPLEGPYADAVRAINAANASVLALDLPSGLSADTGCVLGESVRADVTVTFIGLKQGLFTGAARDYCGHIEFEDLGVPPAVYANEVASAYCAEHGDFVSLLRPRPRVAHKGKFGHVLVVGGNMGFAGAARLAGEAAARSGAGLVTVATRPANVASIVSARPELMVAGVQSGADLAPLLAKATVIAVGPGLGQDQWSRELFEAMSHSSQPKVLDADALNLIAQGQAWQRAPAGQGIVTPHPAEAGRLLGQSTAEVERDRFAAVTLLAQAFGVVAVLKGAGTLVSDGSGPPTVCLGGNPGMAAGGMGDVLTGVIAALVAQGLGLREAAALGVCAHAVAADRAALTGERGMLASDVIASLRGVLNP